jgi:hypothetical protein
MLGDV